MGTTMFSYDVSYEKNGVQNVSFEQYMTFTGHKLLKLWLNLSPKICVFKINIHQ